MNLAVELCMVKEVPGLCLLLWEEDVGWK